MLSLTNAKSGALIGVLVSVTTIPAASNIGVAAAYGEWNARRRRGAAGSNLVGIDLAGVITLVVAGEVVQPLTTRTNHDFVRCGRRLRRSARRQR